MVLKNSFLFLKKKIRSLYFNSRIYDKKISSFNENSLGYRPSPSLLDCLIKYNKKKINIKNYSMDEIWHNQNFSRFEILPITNDVSKLVVKACLKWSSSLNIIIFLQCQHVSVTIENLVFWKIVFNLVD